MVVATSLLRERIGRRVWRLVHLAAYAAWALAVAHGIGLGTDTSEPWARWVYVVSVPPSWAPCWCDRACRRP